MFVLLKTTAMQRTITHIVVHCTATQPETKVSSLLNYWQQHLGWKNPGYHYVIKRNGDVVRLQPDEKIANGAKGYNQQSIHVSYIGGVDTKSTPADNRTDAQKETMFNLLVGLSEKYPAATILGHRDLPHVAKACPSFDVKTWLASYIPVLHTAQ